MPVLKNKKHEDFARAVAHGSQQSAAYREHISSAGDDKTVWAGASALARKVSVRISELRAKIDVASETEFIMSEVETLELLTRAARTPLSCVEPDSDLIVERKTRIETSADKDCQDAWEVTETKKIHPLDAIKEINRMRGRYAADKLDVKGTGKMTITIRKA